MALRLRGLVSKRKRSKLGPTRYFPRCQKRECNRALPIQTHTGYCYPCQLEFRRALGIAAGE